MRVLVVGGGGREHALAWKLAQSPKVERVYAAPGNAGIGRIGECVPIEAEDVRALADFAERERIDLTVVGPEAPLVAGIVDEFESRGLKIFGPRREAAMIEGSKAFAKEICVEAGVPVPEFEVFDSPEEAEEYIRKRGRGVVVKADGLAAGKGSLVCSTVEEAVEAVRAIMVERRFGEAGRRVVIEERLVGEEATVKAFVDGERMTIRLMPAAQDYKPVFDGDRGPNTGGMGCYAPMPLVDERMAQKVEREVIKPVIEALKRRGITYKGVLYAGLMLTDEGPKVLEFNCRFGDPEAQVVLPLLRTDLVEVLEAVIEGRLSEVPLQWSEERCVCVVMASRGYPGAYEKGKAIEGLEEAEALEGVVVFHAGTKFKDGRLVTAGGRVLGVTALGGSFEEARRRAYEAVSRIRFEGAHFRRDIAEKAVRWEGGS